MMRNIRKYGCISIICMMLFASTANSAETPHRSNENQGCYYVSARIGGHDFFFPRTINGKKAGAVILEDMGKCLGCGCNEPFTGKAVKYQPESFLGKSGRRSTDIGHEGFFIQFNISETDVKSSADTFRYPALQKVYNDKNPTSSVRSLDGDYEVIQMPHTNETYFISKNLKTPDGNPLTFLCVKPHPLHEQSVCGFAIQWKDNLRLGIGGFSTTFFKTDEWANLYSAVLKFTAGLERNKDDAK